MIHNIANHSATQEIISRGSALLGYKASLKKDPVGFIKSHLPEKAFRDVFDYLIRCNNALKVEISVTQQRIADDLGISLRWVNEAIKRLAELGLVNYITHLGSPLFKGRKCYVRKRRNVYQISKDILEPSIAQQLGSIFAGLSEAIRKLPKYLAISLLFVNSLISYPKKEILSEYCTSSIISLYKPNHSLRRSIYHSRDMSITLSNEYQVPSKRRSELQLREVTREDYHSRDDRRPTPMDTHDSFREVGEIFNLSGLLKENKAGWKEPAPAPTIDPQEIAERKKALEPQRAALRALKADAARELSELLKGRVTDTLRLKAKGQIYLMRFCDGALLYGLECLGKWGTVDTLINFKLFESACYEYSRNNEVEIEVERYDKLLKELGYAESQPYCQKLLLETALSKSRALDKVIERAPVPVPSRRRITKPSGGSGQVAINEVLKDSVTALAEKLGFAHTLPEEWQNSNKKLDLTE